MYVAYCLVIKLTKPKKKKFGEALHYDVSNWCFHQTIIDCFFAGSLTTGVNRGWKWTTKSSARECQIDSIHVYEHEEISIDKYSAVFTSQVFFWSLEIIPSCYHQPRCSDISRPRLAIAFESFIRSVIRQRNRNSRTLSMTLPLFGVITDACDWQFARLSEDRELLNIYSIFLEDRTTTDF